MSSEAYTRRAFMGTMAGGVAALAVGAVGYLGVPVPLIEDMARLWREACTLEERIALARGLWASDIHEAKIAAAKKAVATIEEGA